MNLAGRKIAVVGGGIGGLAAAIALARRGAGVRVFEQAAALGDVGAGIQVAPNGVAVLEALGLRDAAGACASLPAAIHLRDHRGDRTVARLPLGPGIVARHGRPYWQFHRADLLAVLAAGAAEAGVEIILGTPVCGVEPRADGVRLLVGSGAAPRPDLHVDLVVAADGMRSALRVQRFAGGLPRFTGHVAWRGLVETARLPAGLFPDGVCVTMAPGRHVVCYALREGRLMNFVAIEERAAWTAEGWRTADDPANLRRAFTGCGGAVRQLLDAVSETYLWGLFDHAPLQEWVAGRLVLLGDAAHPMLPFLAQGATMALEDAWVLAAELDAAGDLDRGLVAYQARRRSRTSRVQRAAARSGWIYHLRPGLRDGAHLGLRVLSGLAPGLLLGRFDWLYGADVVSAQTAV